MTYTIRRFAIIGTLLLTGTLVGQSLAGEFNPTLSIGDTAPAWTDLEGTDGKKHSLTDLKEAKAVVVLFTGNTCPYAVEYEERTRKLVERFADEKKVALVAINSNTGKQDSLEAMRERAEEQKFNFPYLKDADQQVVQKFGATRTPEFLVLDADRKVVYMGALDDSTDPEKVTAQHVANAIEATLAGKSPEVTETPPIGCNIRLQRRRSLP
ncbi:MAG: thioredoxin family protein [Pirellulaceae bacterium]